MDQTVISVAGTSRSGSTMLHLMLGSSNQAFAVGEALNWFRPVKTHHFDLSCACGDPNCPHWRSLREVSESQFYRAAFEQTGAQFIIDSSKEISWLIDTRRWANKWGMSVLNIFVWKDPLDLAYSFWKRTGDPLFWRSEFLKYYRRVQQSGLPLVTLNLGDVLTSPMDTIGRLCKAIGMDYEEGMERFWEFEHHHLFGSYGVRKQAQIGESYFQHRSFPREFSAIAVELKRAIKADAEVAELVDLLRASDVSRFSDDEVADRQRIHLSHPFPIWYYAQKTKRRLRKYRPIATELSRSHSVATIPIQERLD